MSSPPQPASTVTQFTGCCSLKGGHVAVGNRPSSFERPLLNSWVIFNVTGFVWSRRQEHHHELCARQSRFRGDTSPRYSWDFKRLIFYSSNCALNNKRKRSMPRKGSRFRWSLARQMSAIEMMAGLPSIATESARLERVVTVIGHVCGPDRSTVRNVHSANR